jgi:uncharacterized protein YlxW (UPF0749 family)
MTPEEQPQPPYDKEKTKKVDEPIVINESVSFKLERAKQLEMEAKGLHEEAQMFQKQAETLESERKKIEESLKEIRRKYNIT